MYTMMNSHEAAEELVPSFHNQPFFSLFFILYIIVGAFFTTNLFVGVVISAYNREVQRLGKNFMLTEKQRRWVETKLVVVNMKPVVWMSAPKKEAYKIRLWCYNFVHNKKFDQFVMLIIVLNTLMMAIKWPGMSCAVTYVCDKVNMVFTVIFILEAIVKLLGYGVRYFKDKWNIFDFCIVVVSLCFLALEKPLNLSNNATTIVRTLRICRMFKLFRKMEQLKTIFMTFVNTIYALFNVGGLMFLIIYIYSVMGITFFADVKMANPPFHSRLNFRTFANSFYTTFRMATGEGWNDLYNELTKTNDTQNHKCMENPKYEDVKDNEPVGCGSPLIGVLFFSSYLIVVTLIFLNLFIAIILNGYFETRDQSRKELNSDALDKFALAWSYFDPDGTGYIKVSDLPAVMFAMGEPLGWDESYRDDPEKQTEYLMMATKGI